MCVKFMQGKYVVAILAQRQFIPGYGILTWSESHLLIFPFSYLFQKDVTLLIEDLRSLCLLGQLKLHNAIINTLSIISS